MFRESGTQGPQALRRLPLDPRFRGSDDKDLKGLADFKSDPALRSVPVVIFTTSHSRQDIARCYAIGANCYVSKPGNLGEFRTAVQAIEQFWFSVASVPD